MANTWIRKPDVVIPPVVDGVYYVGFIVPALRQYCYFQLDLRWTVKGSLQCERGGIREATTVIQCKMMVPLSPTEMVISRGLPGQWLKGAWMAKKGAHTLANLLRGEEIVELSIKAMIDATDDICSGSWNPPSNKIINEPIWLDDNYRPMIILPRDRADTRQDPKRGMRVG